MADITSTCEFIVDPVGQIKHIAIITPAGAATGDTIDLGSDTAANAKVKTILNTLVQDDLGADKTATWVPATGVITLGTITTGIHNLQVWGLG
jgi:hypothetical protein